MYSLSFLQSNYWVLHQNIKISRNANHANLNATPNAHDVVSHIQRNLESSVSMKSHQCALIITAVTTIQRTPLA
jgi:hypothetical protein